MNSLSILICSCDKYSFIWDLHFDFLRVNWNDCPYPIYLGTDSKSYKTHLTLFNNSNDRSWSSCLISWLSQVETDYVLLTLDDFILQHQVRNSDILESLDFVIQENIDCLRLIVRPKPFDTHSKNSNFGKFNNFMPYLIAVQPSIWKKSSLLSLLRSGESIWEFEYNASKRAVSDGTFKLYGTYKTIFNYGLHIVDGGKLLRTSVINIPYKDYGITLPFVSIQDEIIIVLKRVFYFLINSCHVKLRIFILKILSKSKKENKTVANKTNSISEHTL